MLLNGKIELGKNNTLKRKFWESITQERYFGWIGTRLIISFFNLNRLYFFTHFNHVQTFVPIDDRVVIYLSRPTELY